MNNIFSKAIAACVLAVATMYGAIAADMPVNGQTMEQVRASYGEPSSMKGPVGTPAITTWEYDGYCVYFENNLVITSVAD